MFAGLTDRDFDAYVPSKWKSNVYNRERLETKVRLGELAKMVAPVMIAADGAPLLVEASAEHPALWNHKQVDAQQLFFSRALAARKEIDGIIDRSRPMTTMLDDPTPQRNHVFLGVSLEHERLSVALRLHPDAHVDRQNLERKLDDPWQREQLLALLHALPPGISIGVSGGPARPAGAVSGADLGALIVELGQPEAPGKTHWLTVGRSWLRAEIIAMGAGLAEVMRAALCELLPLYHFVAWSRDNDFVSMREQLKHDRQQKRQKGLAKHDKVTIVRGMFSGRSGVIQEIDARGALKVLVGTVAVKVGADEVEKS
jgi:hypothetical protein